MMNLKQLEKRVDLIQIQEMDSEGAHRMEDELHYEIMEEFCPDWAKKEIKRLKELKFDRWYA